MEGLGSGNGVDTVLEAEVLLVSAVANLRGEMTGP